MYARVGLLFHQIQLVAYLKLCRSNENCVRVGPDISVIVVRLVKVECQQRCEDP